MIVAAVGVVPVVARMLLPEARGDSAADANECGEEELLLFKEAEEDADLPDKALGDICILRYRTLLPAMIYYTKVYRECVRPDPINQPINQSINVRKEVSRLYCILRGMLLLAARPNFDESHCPMLVTPCPSKSKPLRSRWLTGWLKCSATIRDVVSNYCTSYVVGPSRSHLVCFRSWGRGS